MDRPVYEDESYRDLLIERPATGLGFCGCKWSVLLVTYLNSHITVLIVLDRARTKARTSSNFKILLFYKFLS